MAYLTLAELNDHRRRFIRRPGARAALACLLIERVETLKFSNPAAANQAGTALLWVARGARLPEGFLRNFGITTQSRDSAQGAWRPRLSTLLGTMFR